MYLQFFSAMLALEKNYITRRVQTMNIIVYNPALIAASEQAYGHSIN